jgi:hypothetical protein
MGMRIGIDFDNTIVCYDQVFHAVALEAGAIPTTLPVNKLAVRDHLRREGREDDWTEMQGVVYTTRILQADPFPGVIDFLRWAKVAGIEVAIISQKTVYPFRGDRNNLHDAARGWIASKLQEDRGPFVPADQVFFEPTKQAKLARIAGLNCTHFIDDLPEILFDPAFPTGATPILFDPTGSLETARPLNRMESWRQILSFFEATWAAATQTTS